MGGPPPRDLTVDPLWWARSDSRLVMVADRLGCAALRLLSPGRREPLTRRWRALVHRGNRVECPACGSRFRHFANRPTTANVVCWHCGSHERHRTLHVFLTRQRPDLLDEASSLLHFAPEQGLEELLRARPGLRYVSCDIEPGRADVVIDITSIDLPRGSFDAVICSHVLEHVPDDAAAMRELHRVVAPGGWCIVMVPCWGDRTYEDPSVTDPDERRHRFWQEDHVRLYGLDVVDRLAAAGFEVEQLRPAQDVERTECERYVLGGDDVFLCRKAEIDAPGA